MPTQSISSVSFNKISNTLTFTGSKLTSSFDYTKFTLNLGSQTYTLSNNDIFTFNNSTSFTLALNPNDSFITALAKSTTATLSLASGWDDVGSTAINNQAINVSTISITGLTDVGTATLDTVKTSPFSTIAITDNDPNSANETYKAVISLPSANGVITGTGLSTGTTSNGVNTYSLTAKTPALLQSGLQALQFAPTLYQLTAGQVETTAFNLSVTSNKSYWLYSASATTNSALALDSSGNLFYQDATTTTKIDKNSASGTSSVLSASLTSPGAIAVDSTGNVYIGDTSNGNITEFSKTGNLIQTITTGFTGIGGIAIDSSGYLDVIDNASGTLAQYATSDASLNWAWNNVISSTATGATNDLVLDSKGNIFVYNTNKVTEYSQADVFLNNFTSTSLTSPTGLAVDSAGNLFVSDAKNGVIKFAAGGTSGSLFVSANVLGATSVATDASGNVFVGYSDGSIVKYTSKAAVSSTILTAAASGGVTAVNLLTDSKSDLFVVNKSGVVKEYYVSPITVATNTVTTPSVAVTSTPPPKITAVSYDETTGELTLSGSNLTTTKADYLVKDLIITGQGKSNYQLIADATSIVNNTTPPTSTQVVFNLSTANQIAVDGLLNQLGSKALDGTVYNLSTLAGWDGKYSPVINTVPITVNPLAPSPSLASASVSYNVSTGVLTITGAANLLQLGSNNGILANDFSLSFGSKSLKLSATDTVSALSSNASAFTISLNSVEQKSVNGLSSASLSVSSGWDAGLGAAVSSSSPLSLSLIQATNIVLSGASSTNYASTLNSAKSILPFAHATVTDANSKSDSAIITVTSGSLTDTTGSLLSKGLTKSGVTTYTIAATSTANLQAELQTIKYIPPTVTPSQAVTLSLTVNDIVTSYPVTPTLTVTSQASHSRLLGADSTGNIYIATENATTPTGAKTLVTETFQKFSSSGVFVGSFSLLVNTNTINHTTVDAKGNIYLSFTGTGTLTGSVQEFNIVTGAAPVVSFTSSLVTPQQLITDSSSNLFVVDSKAVAVYEYKSTGAAVTNTPANAYTTINGLTADSAGNIYIANINSKGASVDEYKAGGLTTVLTQFSGNLVNPQNIAVDSSGNVYVSDSNNNNGAFVDKFNASGSLLTTFSGSFTTISGISVDNKGDLFIAGSNSNSNLETLQEYSSAGVLLRTLTVADNGFSYILDSAGNIYTDSGNNSINKIIASTSASNTVTNTSSIHFVNPGSATVTTYTVSPNDLKSPNVILAPNSGDKLVFNDATNFDTAIITSGQITASGNATTTLAGWVNGVLSSTGGNLASHHIAWFQFGGDSYLLEQAGSAGSAYTASDTLVQLVGVTTNEANALFTGHTLTLV